MMDEPKIRLYLYVPVVCVCVQLCFISEVVLFVRGIGQSQSLLQHFHSSIQYNNT